MRWYHAGVIPRDIVVPHIDSRVKIIDNERPGASPCDLLLVSVRVLLKNIDDIVIFECQLWPKYDFNADLYLLQRKIWRDKKNINMTMNSGQIRFYLRIDCRTLGILWYMYK